MSMTGSALGLLRPVALGVLALVAAGARSRAGAQSQSIETPSTVTVDARVALHALMSLSDAHLQKVADVLQLVAATDAVRSGEWERIRGPLAGAEDVNVAGTFWFALPDGRYWTVAHGPAAARLVDRAYFPRVLAGQTVVGDLVVSRSTGRNSAIVAVPVRGRDERIIGVLGSSLRLDILSAQLRAELGGLPDGLLFFAIDAHPLGAVHSDPAMIFTEPMNLGDEGMRQAFREMLAGQEGIVTYSFRGAPRTVLYRRSTVTGWWYAFGVTQPRASSDGR